MEENKCQLCGEEGRFTCGRCRSVCYCGRDHQRQDYADHRDSCKNYMVDDTPDMGQQVVATCLILPGNLVLREQPFLVGPMAYSDLICLGCYAAITNKDFYKCPDCSWPMCSKACSYAKPHLMECEVLAKDKAGVGVPKELGETPRYDLIMLLRGLLLKHSSPNDWECLMSMESHVEIRKEENDPYHNAAVRYFTEVCNADFDVEEIHRVRGAIMTNCLIFRSPTNTSLRGMYPQVRLFNHSCTPNIHISTGESGEIEARAAVKIEKNEAMCISYTGTTEPLWKRQQYLSEVYKFQCQCKRCLDPTELGTYFSSPRCPDCRRSFMVPPGDGTFQSWVCESCGLKYEFIDVMQEVSEWLYRIDMNDVVNNKSAVKLNKEVEKMHDAFNIKHYVPMQFTQALLKILKDDSYQCHKLRRDIWESHLGIFDVLEPGKTRRRGMTMYQLAVSTLAMARAGVTEKAIYLPRVPDLLQEAKNYLHQAEGILQLEPKNSLERRWLWSIQMALNNVNSYKEYTENSGVLED